jgi:hypothetical protein
MIAVEGLMRRFGPQATTTNQWQTQVTPYRHDEYEIGIL